MDQPRIWTAQDAAAFKVRSIGQPDHLRCVERSLAAAGLTQFRDGNLQSQGNLPKFDCRTSGAAVFQSIQFRQADAAGLGQLGEAHSKLRALRAHAPCDDAVHSTGQLFEIAPHFPRSQDDVVDLASEANYAENQYTIDSPRIDDSGT